MEVGQGPNWGCSAKGNINNNKESNYYYITCHSVLQNKLFSYHEKYHLFCHGSRKSHNFINSFIPHKPTPKSIIATKRKQTTKLDQHKSKK
jgi:hypothetical protein